MALYYWDEQSGDHVVSHADEELRFSCRTDALRAVHHLVESSNARRDHPSHRGGATG